MHRKITRSYRQNRLRYLGSFHCWAMVKKGRFRQFLQALHAVIEWKLRRVQCRSFPFAFRIESAATCNLRCPLCSTTYRKFDPRDLRSMSFELFRTIFEKIRMHAWRITFYMEGEPLMNPRLFDMIALTNGGGHIFTSLSTNLTLMRESTLRPLFQSQIDWISVSLDGMRQTTYETYRVNGKVQHVLEGIAMIIAWRRHNKLRYPYIQVNMIDFFHIPAEERKELEAFCAAQGVDEFRVRPEQFGLMGRYDPVIRRQPSSKCHWPWISMSIDCDGSVYPCPIAFEQRICYGNIATMTLEELWNGELYTATRKYLSREQDIREGLPKLPCYDCRWYGKSPRATDIIAIRKQWLWATRSTQSPSGTTPMNVRPPSS